jgi:hypothetical protein
VIRRDDPPGWAVFVLCLLGVYVGWVVASITTNHVVAHPSEQIAHR